MSVIKKIPEKDMMDFVVISGHAYPSFSLNSKEDSERVLNHYKKIQEEEDKNFYGLYRNDKLLGGMLLHDFKMNYRKAIIDAGGLGSVAVDFVHKKEKVAKELVEAYLEHYKKRNINIALLYPFRPDFYQNMGFGYGTKMNQYQLKPSSFPKSDLRKQVRFLKEDDKEQVIDCYEEYVSKHHGMIKMSNSEKDKLFKSGKIIGYLSKGKLEGFVIFSFKSDKTNFLINDMTVHRLIYNTREALKGIFSFFNSQIDQIRYIILNTQDESIYYMLQNPLNSSNHILPHVYHESNVQGVGLMYRVIDVNGLFKDLKSYQFNHIDCRLKLTIHDNFIKENNQSFYIHFIKGYPHISDDDSYDVEVTINIAEFSSLIMGAVNFKSLYQYSLASISDINYLEEINQLFFIEEKPICMTSF